MENLEKLGEEALYVEMKAMQLQVLENIDMYVNGIFEMANYTTDMSGLPYGIWFDEVGEQRKTTHNIPRVKIMMLNGNMIPVSVEEHPKILLKGVQLSKAERELKGKPKDEMFRFISKNHELILQHWHGKINILVLFNSLKNKREVFTSCRQSWDV